MDAAGGVLGRVHDRRDLVEHSAADLRSETSALAIGQANPIAELFSQHAALLVQECDRSPLLAVDQNGEREQQEAQWQKGSGMGRGR
ncbi:MAG TPA: hypothetical protein VFZ65_03455 [Planctomycetota bacterium]|nr:hypothetical protein [Planctomycetota bacterium]